MGEIFEQIKGSTIVWIILSLATLLSLGWGIYSHLSANKKKRFSVASSTFEVIKHGKNKIQNLKLMFNGESIDNLTISKFAIWNSGNKVINSDDMVTGQELEIYSDENTNILETQIVAEVEPANSFKIIKSTAHNVSIGFDYVDSHEGIVVQIFHTGDKNSLHPKCKIKGGEKIKNYSTIPKRAKRRNRRLHVKTKRIASTVLMCTDVIVMLFLSILLTLYSIDKKFNILTGTPKQVVSVLMDPESIANLSEINLIIFIVVLWGSFAVLIIFLCIGLKNVFSIGVPTKLKVFAVSIDDK